MLDARYKIQDKKTYALCSMLFASCSCPMRYALCSGLHALCPMQKGVVRLMNNYIENRG
jgi:hypothetical protein